MFQFPWVVFKAGELVLRDGELLAPPQQARILSLPPAPADVEDSEFDSWVSRHYSFRAEQFGLERTSRPKALSRDD
jgi:hypothetical protein